MTWMKTLACSIGTLLAVVAPVAAERDTSVPGSLRMRPRAPSTSPQRGTRVAQAATPDQPASGDPLPGDGSDAPPSAEPAPPSPAPPAAPEPAAVPAPPPSVGAAPSAGDPARNQPAEPVARAPRFVVTGSTIERTTLTTPAPLTILHREDLIASGRSTLGDILQQLPAQANAINPQAANGGDGWGRVDLRGLGSNRTLTLLNGRRLVAGGSGAPGSIDVNAIPLAVIERVEVLKAAGSAVYGSDAIGGVVNIITRNDLEGTEAVLYTAAAQRDDGFMYDASVITGHHSKDQRGRIMVAAGIQRQDPVFAGDRLFSRYDVDFGFGGSRPSTGVFIPSSRGRIDASSIDTDGDGKPNPVNLCGDGVRYCTRGADGSYHPFDGLTDGSRQQVDYLRTPSPRFSLFGTGSYELRPWITAFFEASYLHRTSDHQAAREPFSTAWSGLGIAKGSLYNPLGGNVNGYDRALEELGPVRSQQRIGTLRGVAGLQGAIPDDAPVFQRWTWELSYSYGRSDGRNVDATDVSVRRLASALGPSFLDASGVPTCGTLAAPIAGCVPLDVLGPPGSISPEARDYVTFAGTSRGFDEHQTVLAATHGRIATLPHHGELSAAVGADFHAEAAGFTPTGDSLGELQAPGKASDHAFEGFGELSLVPIRGERLADWVELDLAARGSHDASSGNGITWSAGGLFRPVPSFAVRGTYATAFRAPSPGEIFQRTSGPGLPAEAAKVLTAGVVFAPPQLDGLSLTADYWHIDLTQAIHPASATIIFANCYTSGIKAYCDLIHDAAGGGSKIDLIDDPLAQLDDTSTSGLDAAVSYDHTFGGAGRVHEQLEAQVLFAYDRPNDGPGLHSRGDYDSGVVPTLKATWSSAWQHPSGVGAGLNLRYLSSFTQCPLGDCFSSLYRLETDAWYKVDLFGSYTVKSSAGSTTLAAGVNNLLDRNPALLDIGSRGGSDGSTYDDVGRFFYLRLSHRF